MRGRGAGIAAVVALCAVAVAGRADAVPVGPDPSALGTDDAAARSAALAGLRRTLDDRVQRSGFDQARVGVHVVSTRTGRELYAHDADALLNPASNMKLFTSAAALELLGPEFRFETEVWADAEPDARGIVRGNVYIRGKGDPTFVSERMWRLVNDLWHAGVRRITGDIVFDDTYFDDQREGPGWEQEDSDRAYIAPTGALSLNFNAVAIHIRPGSRPGRKADVSVDPDSRYFEIENEVVTGSRRSRRRHIPASIADGVRQRIQVRGVQPINRPGAVYYRRIDNPPYYFCDTFKAFMRRRGVHFNRGRVRPGPIPDQATLLQRVHSHRLAEIVVTMNKVSNNHIAEQLLKTLGAEVMGAPGSWAKGVAAVEGFLDREVGVPPGSYVMKNGSGLNDTNRFSARQVTRLLVHEWHHFQVMPEYLTSLPVAGRDGTTRYRLDGTPAAGVLRGKTGTLENVSALSGYVATATGEVLAYSILVNDHPDSYSRIIEGVDGLAAAIAGFGRPPAAAIAQQAADAAVPATAGADLGARVKTYLALGRAADPRNVRFLETALRTETDPVLRAVVADAIYRSDAALGRRLLLENYQPSAELVAGLSALPAKEAGGTPVLSTVADIAAEGDPGALSRLVETAEVSTSKALHDELAVTLCEVARTAPSELVATLAHSDTRADEAVLRLMIDGLEGEDPARHPFAKALRTALRASDGEEQATEAHARLQALHVAYETILARGKGPKAAPAASAEAPAVREAPSAPRSDGLRPAAAQGESPSLIPTAGGGG